MGNNFCTKCGAMISENDRFCKNCGSPVEINSADASAPGSPMEETRQGAQREKKKKNHGCLIAFVLAFGVIASMVYAFSSLDPVEDTEQPAVEESAAMTYIGGMTDEQAKEIDSILKSCKIVDITEFKHDEVLDRAHKKGETGYRISCKRADGIILYLTKDKKVYQIRYDGHNLYKKGKKKATLEDYTFTDNEISKIMVWSEEQVKGILKSPSTAKFPDITKWGFSKTKKEIVVQGYVDSQNSFGAEIRSEFFITVDRETETMKSFIFDGEELIGK